jgi:hypothetical protein
MLPRVGPFERSVAESSLAVTIPESVESLIILESSRTKIISVKKEGESKNQDCRQNKIK